MKPRAKNKSVRARRGPKSTMVPRAVPDIPFEFGGLVPDGDAPSGRPLEHAALSAAIIVLLGTRASVVGARPYGSDLRISVPATGLATYADAAMICGTPKHDSVLPTHVTNPSVIVEVLSNITESYDRDEKRQHYEQLDSLREYVLIDQEIRRVEVFTRASTKHRWTHHVAGTGDVVTLASVGVMFSVDELYEAAGL